jgi:hypothetical protein
MLGTPFVETINPPTVSARLLLYGASPDFDSRELRHEVNVYLTRLWERRNLA